MTMNNFFMLLALPCNLTSNPPLQDDFFYPALSLFAHRPSERDTAAMTVSCFASLGRARGGLRGASTTTTTCESRLPRGASLGASRRVLVEDVRHALRLGHSGSLGQSRRTRRESLFSEGGGFGGLGNIINDDVDYEIGSKVRVAKEVRIFHVRGCGPEGKKDDSLPHHRRVAESTRRERLTFSPCPRRL